jgi:hypothetical protein
MDDDNKRVSHYKQEFIIDAVCSHLLLLLKELMIIIIADDLRLIHKLKHMEYEWW